MIVICRLFVFNSCLILNGGRFIFDRSVMKYLGVYRNVFLILIWYMLNIYIYNIYMCIYRCHSCSWLRPPVKHHLNFSELKCVMLHNEATQVHETCCLELHGIAFFQVPSFLFLLGWGGVKPLLFASSLTRGVFRVLAASAGTKMPHTFSSLSSPKEFSRTAVILRFVAVIMNDLATMYAIFKFLKSLSWRFMECLLLRGQEPIKPHQWLEFIFLRITITYHLLVKDSILGRFPI